MAEPLYQLDPYGVSEDNLVKGEKHTLTKGKLVRAIAPKKGAFFTDSLKVRDSKSQILTEGEHYECMEIYDTLTLKYNKPVAGMILITDPELESVTIDYQLIGWEYNLPSDFIAKYLNDRDNKVFTKEDWLELYAKLDFLPDLNVHGLGTEYGFEYICYAIEKIRQIILRSELISLDYALELIKNFYDSIPNLVEDALLKTEIQELVQYYIDIINKSLIGLDNVENLPSASHAEGKQMGLRNHKYNEADEKYIITSSLLGFKETIVNEFILKDKVGLDLYKGIKSESLSSLLFDKWPNGARFIIDPIEDLEAKNKEYDKCVYPDGGSDPTTKWLIYKLTNGVDDNKDAFLGISINNEDIYTGIGVKVIDKDEIEWHRIVTNKFANEQIDILTEHINDTNNPHQTQKFHVGLGDVENLPVVTREDILCRKPIRKYVTYDALLLFWKVFLKDVPTLEDEENPEDKLDVAERIRLIFSPCGPCGTEPSIDRDRLGSMQLKEEVEPRGRLVAAWCDRYTRMGRYTDGFGGTYEAVLEEKSRDCMYIVPEELKEKGELLGTFCDGTTLYGKYADGNAGYYVAIIFEDSDRCGGGGGIPTSHLVPVTRPDGEILGYGYTPTQEPGDRDANVLLRNNNDEPLAYIYAEYKEKTLYGFSADVELKNELNQVLGYMISPTII